MKALFLLALVSTSAHAYSTKGPCAVFAAENALAYAGEIYQRPVSSMKILSSKFSAQGTYQPSTKFYDVEILVKAGRNQRFEVILDEYADGTCELYEVRLPSFGE